MPRSGQQITDLETHRAINFARYAGSPRNGFNKGKRRLGSITYNGRFVVQFIPKRRYVMGGAKAGSQSKYTHISRVGWLCWFRGKPVGMAANYLCGGLTFGPIFTHEPMLIICPKCKVADIGYEHAAKVLDSSASPTVES